MNVKLSFDAVENAEEYAVYIDSTEKFVHRPSAVGTWMLNTSLNLPTETKTFSIEGYFYNRDAKRAIATISLYSTHAQIVSSASGYVNYYYGGGASSGTPYLSKNGNYVEEAYSTTYKHTRKVGSYGKAARTITISGGTDAEDPYFTAWLCENATMVEGATGLWQLSRSLTIDQSAAYDIDVEILSFPGASSSIEYSSPYLSGIQLFATEDEIPDNGWASYLNFGTTSLAAASTGADAVSLYWDTSTSKPTKSGNGVREYKDNNEIDNGTLNGDIVVYISGGSDIKNENFISWLKSNATRLDAGE